MKRKTILILIIAFLIVESILGYFSQTTFGTTWSVVSYITVVLAFLINLIFINKSHSFLFSFLALFFTLIADYFLVILNDYYLLGVISFLIVQSFYFLRIYFETKTQTLKLIHLISRCSLSLISTIIVLLTLNKDADLLSIFSIICYINLILNVIFSFINLKNNKQGILLSMGLLLFAFCDFFVGLNNLSNYFSISNNSLLYSLIHCNLNLAWVFYTPSQALLGISLYPYYIKEN